LTTPERGPIEGVLLEIEADGGVGDAVLSSLVPLVAQPLTTAARIMTVAVVARGICGVLPELSVAEAELRSGENRDCGEEDRQVGFNHVDSLNVRHAL
jgi:hypothetical protein